MKRETRQWSIGWGHTGERFSTDRYFPPKGARPLPRGVRFNRRLMWAEVLSAYARLIAAGWQESIDFIVFEGRDPILPGCIIPQGRPPIHRKKRAAG